MKLPGPIPLLVCCVAVLSGGCGADTKHPLGQVTGTVTIDGQPLDKAFVIFQPNTGRSSTGVTDKEGRYSLRYKGNLQGARLGQHRVVISTENVQENPATGQRSSAAERVPTRYNSRSTLTTEVQEGDNTRDFHLLTKTP